MKTYIEGKLELKEYGNENNGTHCQWIECNGIDIFNLLYSLRGKRAKIKIIVPKKEFYNG